MYIIPQPVKDLLNTQVQNELYNAHLYRTMSNYYDDLELKGLKSFFQKQSLEETSHAQLILDYMSDLGVSYTSLPIAAANVPYTSPLQTAQDYLNAEHNTTTTLNSIATAALQNNDNLTYTFMQKMLAEQIEEIATATEFFVNIQNLGADKSALLLMDERFGEK